MKKREKLGKEEIMRILNEEMPSIEDPEKKYIRYVVIIEIKRVREDLAMVKGEYYRNNSLEFEGGWLYPIDNPEKWENHPVGKSKFHAFVVNSREKGIGEKFIEWTKKRMDEGKLPIPLPISLT